MLLLDAGDVVVHDGGDEELERGSQIVETADGVSSLFCSFDLVILLDDLSVRDGEVVLRPAVIGHLDGRSDWGRRYSQVLDNHVSWVGANLVETHLFQVLGANIAEDPLGFFWPHSLLGVVARPDS